MNQLLSAKTAALFLISLLSLAIAFHVSVILGVIPFENVWGGNLKTNKEMLVFESVSIVINLIMVAVVSVKASYWKIKFSTRLVTVLLWCMVVVFSLNTIGNLVANNPIEQTVGTAATLILALLSLRLAIER